MTYRVQDRLRHASDRFQKVNIEKALYSGERNGTSYTIPLGVSPILMSADEISPGNPSAVRVEYQDFGIQKREMGSLYPPRIDDTVLLTKNKEKFTATSIGGDEPPYQHVTSSRERILLHTARVETGY